MVPASNRTDIAVEGAWLLATPDFTMPEKVVKSVESRTGIPGHMTMFQQECVNGSHSIHTPTPHTDRHFKF
jgi:hypothetical protein